LDEFVVEGIKTTIPFHRQLMDHPDYIAGNYTTAFMEGFEIQPEENK
jgi:acetyl-CoA carboxylase biotin carboxylase subunit